MTEPATTTAVKESRIPSALSRNVILADFCRQYLESVDEIAAYNKDVLAEKSSEWTAAKVLAKARELGNPTDAEVAANEEVKKALTVWEEAVTAVNLARRSVLETTSKELGIVLSSVASERDPEIEGPLREKRSFASDIGKQLDAIAKMTRDEKSSDAVKEFLEKNPLPAVGREQTTTFGASEAVTPKFRVNIKVTDADGNVKVQESGFTKTALSPSLTALYERGQAPKADKLRAAWVNAGNTPENTIVNPVTFEDNGLIFEISKK